MTIDKQLFILAKHSFDAIFRTIITIYENNFILKKKIKKLEIKIDFIVSHLEKGNNFNINELREKLDNLETDFQKDRKKIKSKLFKEAKTLNDIMFDGEINSNYYANEVFNNHPVSVEDE